MRFCLTTNLIARLRRILNADFLSKYKYLIIILFFAIVIRIIWLKLTVIGDEGELGYDSMLWLHGQLPYSVRLSEKPPLSYLIYMISVFFFGNTVIPVRIFNDVLFFISIIPLYLLVKDWYGKEVGLVASFFYVLFLNAPAFWGPFAVPIYLSMPFTILSVYMCNKHVGTNKIGFLFASGIFLSIAGLIRLDSFIIIIVLLVILVVSKGKNPVESSKKFLHGLTGSILVLMATILFCLLIVTTYFWAIGALDRVISNVLTRPVLEVGPALSEWNPPFGWQFLGFVEGLPILVFTILGCLACSLVRTRRNLFVISWLLAPLPLLLALEPHDSYHLAVLAPAASTLSALALYQPLKGFGHSKNANRLSSIRKHDIQGIFIVAIFILLLLPSTYFQALQFPNGTIHWEFIDYPYSTIGNYDQITQLTTYLRSLNVTDGTVLIQDWVPYVYWLTGIKAPSAYLNTYQIGLGIPSTEYERLFTEVKDKKIPYVIVVSERPQGTDPITDFVRSNYFILKSIGGVDIYGASYSTEEGVFFSFIANLSEAQQLGVLPNGTIRPLKEISEVVIPRVEKPTVDDVTQFAIRQHPLVAFSNITYSNVMIPSNATLEFSIAMDSAVWTESGDGVVFEIDIEHNGQSGILFSKYIDPKHNEGDRRWYYYSIPFEEYGSQVIRLSFVTNPGPYNDSNWDWAYWGNPLIRQGK
jgi:hypothetical protein